MMGWDEIRGQALWAKGVAGQVLRRGEVVKWDGSHLILRAPLRALTDRSVVGKVRDFVTKQVGSPVRVQIVFAADES